METMTLHKKDNSLVEVPTNAELEGGNKTGTTLWWVDENGDKQSVSVKESPEEIKEIIKK